MAGAAPSVDAAGIAFDVGVTQLAGVDSSVVAPRALDEAAVNGDRFVFIGAEQ